MGWIDDWTTGLVNGALAAFKAPFEAVIEWWADLFTTLWHPRLGDGLERQARKAKVGTSPLHPIARGVGAIINFLAHLKAMGEPDLQETRISVLKESHMYPPDAETLARFTHFSESHRGYLAAMANLQGKFPSTLAAYYEITRKPLEPVYVRELFNRGIVTKELATELLKEQGYRNERLDFSPDPDGLHWNFAPVTRGDLDGLFALFNVLPALQDIVRMDVRDVFPKDPGQHPPWVTEHPAFKEWFSKEGHKVKPIDWPKEGQDITEALQMGEPPYGPESFASYFLGGRQEYTTAFETAAKAQGLDPYWSMKFWESHWILPGFQTAREMLHRVPKIDEAMFKNILRWQDFPPELLDSLTRIAYRPLTRVDVRRMHLRGVIGVPRVFKAYLDFGYAVDNAARMTAFTVTWNADRAYGSLIDAVLKSYAEGATERSEAVSRIIDLIRVDLPATLPPWVTDELTPPQIQALKGTYEEIRDQLIQWAGQQLMIAETNRELTIRRNELKAARKHYVGWEWTITQTKQYLAEKGYSQARIEALGKEWEPEREAGEKLPTLSMLEDFLLEQDMPVSVWWDYMRKLKYSDEVINEILTGTGRLPTRGMLEGFYLEGLIDRAGFQKQMARLGFDSWTVTKLLIVLDRILAEKEEGD